MLVDYRITFKSEDNLDFCGERLSPTSRARCENEELSVVWVTPVIRFYIKNPEDFVSSKKMSINLTNELFPLYVDPRKIDEALNDQDNLLSQAKDELQKKLTNIKNEKWWTPEHKLSSSLKIITLDRDMVISTLKEKLTKMVSFYDDYGDYLFTIRIPKDADIPNDFDEFEAWARGKLGLSGEYRIVTAPVVESVDEVEHYGGLPWYKAKPIEPRPRRKTSNLSESEQEYVDSIRKYASQVRNLTADAVLISRPPHNFYRGRDMAEYYGVEREWNDIKTFTENYDEYDTMISDLKLFVKRTAPSKIFIDKAQLGDKVGLFIGKGGRNIKALSQRIGRRIVLV